LSYKDIPWYFSLVVRHSSLSPLSKQQALEPATSPATLHTRKRQFVRDELWNTAVKLFAEKGFDETTIDDIAQAAGVSRRSFFRYFSSKNDLMAQSILTYGVALTEAIDSCPRTYSLSEVLRETVLQIAQRAAAYPASQTVMQIAAKYPAAREAQLSRMGEVQKRVADAFARRCSQRKRGDLTPEVLAALTMSLMDVTLRSWFERDQQDVSATVKQVFTVVGNVAGEIREAEGSKQTAPASDEGKRKRKKT
jgi:AcrR family transcriptional regulator